MLQNCRLCNSSDLKFFYSLGHKNRFEYFKCSACGLVNLDMDGLAFSDHQTKYFDEFIQEIDYEKANGARQSFNFIKKYVPKTGRFMDIGCGSGGVSYFAQKNGWEVKGLDISTGFAKFVSEKLGIVVDVADFLEYENQSEKFDLISLRHVLEHLPDSKLALNKISTFLNPAGYAHLEFPNINGISFRVKRFLKRTGVRRPRFAEDFTPGHCNEFSKRSFAYLLEKTGFKLIRWETYSTSSSIKNFLYNHIHHGIKARVIIQKV